MILSKKRKPQNMFGYLTMIILGAVVLLPMFYLFFGSFKPREEMFTYPPTLFPQRWTTGNYATLILHPGLSQSEVYLLKEQGEINGDILYTEDQSQRLKNSNYGIVYSNILIIVLLSALGVIILGGAAGYSFAKIHFLGREAAFYIIISTMMIPWMIVIIPQYIIYRNFGLVGSKWPMLLQELLFGLLNGGFMIFFFRQHFRAIPDEICESAKLDGANHIRILFSLMFPLSKPIIISAFFFTLVMKWNDMLRALIYLTKPTLYIPVQVSYYLTRSIGNEADPLATGLVMAASVLAIAPFLLVFFIGQRYFIQGLTSGAVKN